MVELNIWKLRDVLGSFGNIEYIVNDFQKNNYGQPTLSVATERDGNIYAFIDTSEGQICLCEIKSEKQLMKLKDALLGNINGGNVE